MRSILVSDAAAQFLAYAATTVSPITYDLYRRYITKLVDDFPGRRLVTLTPAEIRSWGKTYHPVQAVQRLCSWAKGEARLINVNPLEGMRKVPRGRRIRTLTARESVKLLRDAKDGFRDFLLALRESIARPGELRRTTFDDVRVAGLQPAGDDDLAAGRAFVFLGDFKARDDRADQFAVRVIPISPRLGRLIVRRRRARQPGQSHVWINRRGRPWTHNAVCCRLRRWRDAVAIGRDHRGERIVAYSMRHTSATEWICRGGDVTTLSAVLGHSDVRMTMRYLHLSPAHLTKAMKEVKRRKPGSDPKNDRPGSH